SITPAISPKWSKFSICKGAILTRLPQLIPTPFNSQSNLRNVGSHARGEHENDWVQHLNILTPPDDKCLKYVRADELQPQQVDELLAIYIAYLERWPTAPVLHVGLWVYVDGRHWISSYANSERFFFEEWFAGLRTVLRSEESAKASVEI
ncbi:hypothetical protein ACQ4M4_22220, partial [Leptolyngbya sp. AN02str]|uniref:hypothetical protein n=1 Tax=Leptolyngbya sp. AN02str TaxID=3423363 RepID=UPI003D3101C5